MKKEHKKLKHINKLTCRSEDSWTSSLFPLHARNIPQTEINKGALMFNEADSRGYL